MYTTICKSNLPSALNYEAADDEPICAARTTTAPPKPTTLQSGHIVIILSRASLRLPFQENHTRHTQHRVFHKLMKDHELASRPGPTPSRKSKAQLRWERLENAFQSLKR